VLRSVRFGLVLLLECEVGVSRHQSAVPRKTGD
jgi:hypothetical protein